MAIKFPPDMVIENALAYPGSTLNNIYNYMKRHPHLVYAHFGDTVIDNNVSPVFNRGHGMPDGVELVTNGDFSDGATGWTVNYLLGTSWSIGSDVASYDDSDLSSLSNDDCAFVVGEVYQIQFTISNCAGNANIGFWAVSHAGGNVLKNYNNYVNGTHTIYVVSPVTGSRLNILGNTSGVSFDIDDISCQKICTGTFVPHLADPFFDTASPSPHWTENTWTIGSGKATHPAGVADTLEQSGKLQIGVEYQTFLKVSGRTAGSVTLYLGTTAGTVRSTNDIFEQRITCAGNTTLAVAATDDFDGSVEFVLPRPVSSYTNGRYAAHNPVLNGFFANWTGDDPDDWTVSEVGDATSNVTENPAGHCQIISDGTVVSMYQGILEVGKYYVVTIHVATIGSGGIKVALGGSYTNLTTVGVHEIVGIGEGTNLYISRIAACDVTIDFVWVEQILIEPSSAYPKAESLSEAGDGVMDKDNWAAGASATITNPSTGILRIARNGANNPNGYQIVLTAGLRYKCTGETRSDGNAQPGVRVGTGSTDWLGTTSTDWQSIDFEVEADNTIFALVSITSTGTEYTEWRNLSVREVNPLNGDMTAIEIGVPMTSKVPRGLGGNGATSVIDNYCAELNAILPRDEFAIAMLIGFDDPESGADEYGFNLYIDPENYIRLYKNTSDDLLIVREGNNTQQLHTISPCPAGVNLVVLSVSVKNDSQRYQLNGAEVAEDTGLDRMIGNFASNSCAVFALNITPSGTMEGKGACFMLFDSGGSTEAEWAGISRLLGAPS